MEGGIIQQVENNQKPKKMGLKQEQSDLLDKIINKRTEPFKIKGKLRDDIAAAVRDKKLSMSAISTKFDVNKHAVLKIRKQELGR